MTRKNKLSLAKSSFFQDRVRINLQHVHAVSACMRPGECNLPTRLLYIKLPFSEHWQRIVLLC